MIRGVAHEASDRHERELPAHSVRIRGLDHHFGKGEGRKQALYDINLDISAGEIVIVTGPSGSGKTTLLTLIGALRAVQSGSICVMGKELAGLDGQEQVGFRRQIGFIFQLHNLFESLSARRNVRMSLELHGHPRAELDRVAIGILAAVGLGDRLHYKPGALSGGQRQRVAVARALAPRPKLILADEPTAALDGDSSLEIVSLLQRLAKEEGSTTVLVTHDSRLLGVADRVVNIVDGRIASDVLVRQSVEICEFLARTQVFSTQTPGALAEMAEKMVKESYPAGRTIFRQGDVGDRLFLIKAGAVEIVAEDERAERKLALLGVGDVFGEMALMAEQPRNASATVREDVELYSLSKEHFRTALARSKSFRDQVLGIFSARQ
jgi:putative ABC transport system ATP-binding protein